MSFTSIQIYAKTIYEVDQCRDALRKKFGEDIFDFDLELRQGDNIQGYIVRWSQKGVVGVETAVEQISKSIKNVTFYVNEDHHFNAHEQETYHIEDAYINGKNISHNEEG